MTQPIRVQQRRVKGWRMPPNTVSVARPWKWRNPFEIGRDGDRSAVIRKFEEKTLPILDLRPLRGKNLACFCALDAPCHADVLLREANKPLKPEQEK